jgi:hypothetical protein
VPIDENFLAYARRESAAVPARIWRSIYYEQLACDPSPLLQDIFRQQHSSCVARRT